MHLKRVRVPNFRVLQDVDITFEPDLIPRIFPLGSINGGGKSTLLQLIFTLLHCCGDEQRIPYLQNMLDGFDLEDDSGYRDLATIDLVIDGEDIELKFFLCDGKYINNKLELDYSKTNTIKDLKMSEIMALPRDKEPLIQLQKYIHDSRRRIKNLHVKSKNVVTNIEANIREFELEAKSIAREGFVLCSQLNSLQEYRTNFDIYMNSLALKDVELVSISAGRRKLKNYTNELSDLINRLFIAIMQLFDDMQTTELSFKKNDRFKAFPILSKNSNIIDSKIFLISSYPVLENSSIGKSKIIKSITGNIFLAAPATQVFHFLTKRDRLLLFRTRESKSDNVNYSGKLGLARAALQGFFPYDAFSPEFLIETLESAIDNDIKDIRSTGKYGDSYPKLVTELEQALSNQKVSVDLKAGTITFTKTDDRGHTVELYPEDLSHGELKRLSLYVWLKYNNIENAIVLMDEVEIALHPDWQYGMINDLQTWAPNNQYILATHSYEMCQALTPAHVKEIEPKLLKKQK